MNTIEKAPAYKVGTKLLATLAEAQKEALGEVFEASLTAAGCNSMDAERAAGVCLANSDAIVEILTPPKELRSRAPRKDKGTKRGSKKTAAPAPVATAKP